LKEERDPIIPLIISISLFMLINQISVIYQSIADACYRLMKDILPTIQLPPPNINELTFNASLWDLLVSPSNFLQAFKVVFDVSNTVSSNDVFKPLQLLLNGLSAINVILSYFYKTNIMSIILSISMILAYVQVEVLLIKYFLQAINAIFDNMLLSIDL